MDDAWRSLYIHTYARNILNTITLQIVEGVCTVGKRARADNPAGHTEQMPRCVASFGSASCVCVCACVNVPRTISSCSLSGRRVYALHIS